MIISSFVFIILSIFVKVAMEFNISYFDAVIVKVLKISEIYSIGISTIVEPCFIVLEFNENNLRRAQI